MNIPLMIYDVIQRVVEEDRDVEEFRSRIDDLHQRMIKNREEEKVTILSDEDQEDLIALIEVFNE